MKNKKMTRKITQGMYVLTTEGGGCIVDAVSQISSSEDPLIAVAVMKQNYTNTLLKKNRFFALSVLSKNTNPEIIKTFGFKSMRDTNKFSEIATITWEGINIVKDTIGYMVCEIIDSIENDTHTLFIAKLIEADAFNDQEPMSYAYYQENKENLLKVTTSNGKTAWVCTTCGYIYYGNTIPDNFKCPICGVDKSFFKKVEKEDKND